MLSVSVANQQEVLELDLDVILARDFADEYEIASRTTAAVLSKLAGSDLSPLARRSPSLAGYDWVATCVAVSVGSSASSGR